MKKRLSFLLLVTCYLLIVTASPAQSATPTPENKIQELRDQLIDNIASRVAQLKLVEKRGITGIVTDVTNTQITLTDLQNNTRFVDVDELTKFSSPKNKETFGISDISKDMTIGVLGLYNKESRRILARFVSTVNIPLIIHGAVAKIDNQNFTLYIATKDNDQITVDIENLTRTFSYTQSGDYTKSGFSKIKENNSIIAVGVLNIGNKNRMTAARVIFFPEIPGRISK